MCKGGPALGTDKASRIERWGVATDEELQQAAHAKGVVWLDVRTEAEIEKKPLPGSDALDLKCCNVTMFHANELVKQAPTLLPSQDVPILVFCAVGGRADVACQALKKMGYKSVTNAGGVEDITAAVPDIIDAAVNKKTSDVTIERSGGCCNLA